MRGKAKLVLYGGTPTEGVHQVRPRGALLLEDGRLAGVFVCVAFALVSLCSLFLYISVSQVAWGSCGLVARVRI